MEVLKIVRENWFTREPRDYWLSPTLILTSLMVAVSFSVFTNFRGAGDWLIASPDQVFNKHEYWRAWTTLLAHADLSHLVSNTMLFLPLVYLLTAYFGLWLFPVTGFFLGGIVNLLVLKNMPLQSSLLGVSGVVYWMGAVWLTLFFMVDRRKNPKARFANILFLMLMLFIPETYEPHISYLSHFLGFVFGVASALIYYFIHRAEFNRAEVVETIYEDDSIVPDESFDDGFSEDPIEPRWN
jgi:rhomboid protease GluP